MTTYRERLTAPITWWLAAVAFAGVWGWVMLVATNWPIAIVVTAALAAVGVCAVWRYGSVLIAVDDDTLRVGRASIARHHIGAVRPLGHADYRQQLGVRADARAYLATRPYLGRGVVVPIEDARDPAPYWLVSSRRPDALAAALGHTGLGHTDMASHDTIGETPRGEEEQED